MISYGEQNSNENYKKLLEKFPDAKRIHGVKGIANAHIAAAEICETDMMWIIDGDAEVVDGFDFSYVVPECDKEAVETMKMLNKDTKPCPSCGTMIHKVSGCNQMWCPSCKNAFDWRSGRIERGVIHNPHYYQGVKFCCQCKPLIFLIPVYIFSEKLA